MHENQASYHHHRCPTQQKGNSIARKKQQQLKDKAPKKAHKEIFKDKYAQPRQTSKLWKTLKQAKLKLSPPDKPGFLKSTLDFWQAINI